MKHSVPLLAAACLLVGTFAAADYEIGPYPDVPGLPLDPPHSIRLLFGKDAATEMTLVWGSATEGPGRVRLTGPGIEGERVVEAVSHRFPEERYPTDYTGKGAQHALGYIQVARVMGLEPGSTYAYQVGTGLVWSEPYTFRTAPRAFAGEVRFTAYGDSYPGEFARAVVAGADAKDPHFHLHLGDLSYADSARPYTEAWWRVWFTEQQPLMTGAPYMPAMGNHERDKLSQWDIYHIYGLDDRYWQFSRLWPLPDPATAPAWSFRWGDLAVVSIWVDGSTDPMRGHQLERLKQELARYDGEDVKWRVVTMHAPPYSTSAAHGSACRARLALEPVLRAHSVDLVLAAHDHSYERTYPAYDGAAVFTASATTYPKGLSPAYVVAGIGGDDDRYPFTIPPSDKCGLVIAPVDWSAARHNDRGYVLVTETAEGLRVESWSAEGNGLLDAFTLQG